VHPRTPDGQIDALNAAGCEKIFADTTSGKLTERPELTLCLGHLRAGDALVVWRLDRLGRSLRHLIDVATDLGERGVGLRSLTENIDTTTAGGRLIFDVFGALAPSSNANSSWSARRPGRRRRGRADGWVGGRR
jgi:DNA invertase Pin-like site-specific DNA recombinase